MIDFITLAISKKYTNEAIAESAAVRFKYIIADSLPASGEEQTIYFIKNNSSWKDNYYDEYLWISDTNNFEKIGSTEIDSNFLLPPYTEEDVGKILTISNNNTPAWLSFINAEEVAF